ncbi:MAG: protein RarD [unclassified Hahellaceae]|nr:protein RarD [Hahellaceae bacterium]|tara:strand:+ start:10689 stop:11615 length:927 start_codon:yes stop_codon:yes gene_type:complete
MSPAAIGIGSAFLAFFIWGFLPLYLKLLGSLGSWEILAHRMVWSLLFLAGLLTVLKQWRWLKPTLRSRRLIVLSTVAALLLSANWITYIWAVNSGFIVNASLGYFINPLISVLLGFLFLQERMRSVQWLSVALAASGVVYLTISMGELPWIALVLGFSFGFYGLLRKQSVLNSPNGLTLETMILSLPALAYLLWLEADGSGAFLHSSLSQNLLMIGTGVITATPLLLFAHAAQRIPLATLGLLQYTAPSIQLLLGVFLYDEPFGGDRMIAFGLIWTALAIYSGEGLLRMRRRPKPAAASEAVIDARPV